MCYRCLIAQLNRIPASVFADLAAAGVVITGLDAAQQAEPSQADLKAKAEGERLHRLAEQQMGGRFTGETINFPGLGEIPVMVLGAKTSMAEAMQEAHDMAAAGSALDSLPADAAGATASGLAAGASLGASPVDDEGVFLDPFLGVNVYPRVIDGVRRLMLTSDDAFVLKDKAWHAGANSARTEVTQADVEYQQQLEAQSGEMRDMLLLALGGLIGGNPFQNAIGVQLLAKLKELEDEAE